MTDHQPLGQQLIGLGLINREQLEVALAQQKKAKQPLGEMLLALRFISEIDILKVLAERMRIHYISSDKLSKIQIPTPVLSLIPQDYAERRNILPLLYDSSRRALSVLASDPSDGKLLKEVQLLTASREVNAYLCMKPVISAAINRLYKGDSKPLDNLEESSAGQGSLLLLGDSDRQGLSAEDTSVSGLRLADEVQATSLLTDNLFVETLNILISLIEMRGNSLRGHSASVARLTKAVSEKLDLLPKDIYFNVVAAYFHNLGKRDNMHHTLINLKLEKDLKLAQKFYLAPVRLIESAHFPRIVPQILTHLYERMDGKGFPDGLSGEKIPLGSRIIAAVDAYEDLVRNPEWAERPIHDIFKELFHYQGSCFDRQVLRALYEVIVEAQRKTSVAVGDQLHTAMFIDPKGTTYSHIIARLKESGFRVLVARNTDAAADTLKQTGVDLVVSEVNTEPLNGFQMCRALKSNSATRDVGFMFISTQEISSRTINMAFDVGAEDFFGRPLRMEVILGKIRRFVSNRPRSLKELKAQTTPARSAVTGTLSELGLPDVIQLLAHGRKTGMLALVRRKEEARIFMENGMVINAFIHGKQGTEAFYEILSWEDGEFSFSTDVTMPEQLIQMPVENLMLEGFRLLDEKRAGR